MRFYMDSKDMNEGVLSVIKALPVRTTMPILEGVYIEAKKDGVRLKCTDLMLQKECITPATVEEEGAVIVPGKLFGEIVRKLPAAIAEFALSGKTIEINCGRAKSSIQCIEFEEFPEMRFSGDTYIVKLNPAVCRDMINETVFAVAQDESKPVLTGALLEIGESFNIVATDAYQFAYRSIQLPAPLPEKNVIVPGKSLVEIARMTEETEKDVELTFTRTHVKVDLGHSCLTARLIDGDYIKYRQIIPKEHTTRAIVDVQELMESIDRAQLMAREGNNNIVMKFSGGKLSLSANSFIGKANEEMDVQIIGEDMEIAFNPRFCMNVLKNIGDQKVVMDFNSSISPCVIHPLQGEAYFYLIVPVRIYTQF